MYILDNWHKFVFVFLIVAVYSVGINMFLQQNLTTKSELAATQLNDQSGQVTQQLKQQHTIENSGYIVGWFVVGVLCFLVFIGDLRKVVTSMSKINAMMLLAILALSSSGCYKPFEPVKLEVISPNEEAFLLTYIGDSKTQSASNNEEYLKEKLVYTKQVKIPQQWVPVGFETYGFNGHWQDAAILVKVDKSPVTREWTADATTGTSNKNEAIWVMTSDQVEFSTGWTITARIETKDDAVTFLHNYPNGSLVKVLDSEVRGKLQSVFGLEVTDLPMETLKKAATPHILNTVKEVTEFFKERGISITNLGITGGFIYKNPSIMEAMVKVYVAEQDKSVAMAETSAQEERNKKVIFEATGKADALLKSKQAEADGIEMVAKARKFEMEQATTDLKTFLALKTMDLQKEYYHKWDGSLPKWFMGANNPSTLLQLPPVTESK